MKKFLKKLWIYLKPFTNLKFLISFGLAWMITNGWCYLFILFGSIFNIQWMWAVGTGYAAILYLPFTAEKLITIPLSIFFQTILFPKDIKIKNQLINMKIEAKKDWNTIKFKLWCWLHIRKIRQNKLCIINYDVKKHKNIKKYSFLKKNKI